MLGEVLRIPWLSLKEKAIPLGSGEMSICMPRPSPHQQFSLLDNIYFCFLLDSTRSYSQGPQIKSAGFRQH